MKKFIMVPDESYNSLLNKTTIDDFAEHFLNAPLENNSSNAAKKLAQYNQRIQGYLDRHWKNVNKPVRVILENEKDAIVQIPKRDAASIAVNTSTQTEEERQSSVEPGEMSYDEIPLHLSANDQRQTPKYNKKRIKKPEKIYGTPSAAGEAQFADSSFSAPAVQRQIEPREIQNAIEDIQQKATHSPQAQRKMLKNEAAERLLEMISRDRKKFGVSSDGKVISSTGQSIGGSNFVKLIDKYKEGKLVNLNGDRPFKDRLLNMDEAKGLAAILFGTSPRRTRSGNPLQKGSGLFNVRRSAAGKRRSVTRATGRFKVRNWCI